MDTWSKLFPRGRHIYYEGDDPEGFRAEILERFGFDVAEGNDDWGVLIDTEMFLDEDYDDYPKDAENRYVTLPIPEEEQFTSYSFRCPAEYLDAIYGSRQYPMGS